MGSSNRQLRATMEIGKKMIGENNVAQGRFRTGCASVIAAALIFGGCASDSGFIVCRAKGEKELTAEQRSNAHYELAESYRFHSHDEDRAGYHEALGKDESERAAKESNPLMDMFLAVFGNCDR